ncbi:MAG TPA: hypothetical protein VFA67_09250 [Candidatus Sulfotelmatobacter sp.]|nr:hypothetical protein [Candidatus Sulfotelmatobacter sp.]
MKAQRRKSTSVMAIGLLLLGVCSAIAQQAKSKADLTGRYEGTAKNRAEEVIPVTLDLTEKDGAITGTISSSHGDFAITSGSRQGKTVTLQFEAEGTAGTISLEASEDSLAGTWSAGDDGGPFNVKKSAGAQNGKS